MPIVCDPLRMIDRCPHQETCVPTARKTPIAVVMSEQYWITAACDSGMHPYARRECVSNEFDDGDLRMLGPGDRAHLRQPVAHGSPAEGEVADAGTPTRAHHKIEVGLGLVGERVAEDHHTDRARAPAPLLDGLPFRHRGNGYAE